MSVARSGEHAPTYLPPLDVASEAGSPLLEWRRYADAIWRARLYILILGILGTAGGLFVARSTSLMYRAQSTLWIETATPAEAARGPIRPTELLRSYGWIELLRSFAVLDHTVRELRLFVEADSALTDAIRSLEVAEGYRAGGYRLTTAMDGSFVLETEGGSEIQRGQLGDSIGRGVGILWRPSRDDVPLGDSYSFWVHNIRDRSLALGEMIEPQMLEDGNFLRLSLTGSDPTEAAATLQSVSERFVEVAAELKRGKLEELTGVLAGQLSFAEGNLRSEESALEEFRINTITLPAETATPIAPGVQATRDPVLGSFFDLRIEHEALRGDRAAIDELVGQVRQGLLSPEALLAIPSVAQSRSLAAALEESGTKEAELRALLERYTDDHEQVRQLRAEIATLNEVTIPTLVIQVRDQLAARESIFNQRIASASNELEQIPPRAIEEARLVRRVEIANNLHATLRQRYEEARLATESSIPDIRVLDQAAAPTAPISDRRTLFLLLAVFGSLGVGVFGAVAKEMVDSRIRYPEQITGRIGLPVLGAVPHLKGGTQNKAHMLEAFREVRLSLMHAHGTAGPVVLTITSPESGDGKSFVTANLAMSFASRGDRTLVIDADTRRGNLHHRLGGESTPGLTELLLGSVSKEAVIQPTNYANLSLIGSGRRTQAGPELLASTRLPALLASLRSEFDVILVDSPPMGAGADAYVLASVTRDLLVVLRTGVSDGGFAEAKLDVMDRLPVRILGAVLNAFTPGRLHRYYSYLPGYVSEVDGRTGLLPTVRESAVVGSTTES